MKKSLIASLALVACSAMADTGPIYVTTPGYCNAKKLYINSLNQFYGYEVGCAALSGQPIFGVVDSFNNVLLSNVMTGGYICMDKYRPDGLIQSSCSNGQTVINMQTLQAYAVSWSPPAHAVIRSKEPLPNLHEVLIQAK